MLFLKGFGRMDCIMQGRLRNGKPYYSGTASFAKCPRGYLYNHDAVTCDPRFTDTPLRGRPRSGGNNNAKPQRCLPCKPPVGTLGYRYDTTHTHAGIEGGHTHHFLVIQRPPQRGCICQWQRDFKPATRGYSPLRGAIEVQGKVLGGGVAP
jgi:hypothetical protein